MVHIKVTRNYGDSHTVETTLPHEESVGWLERMKDVHDLELSKWSDPSNAASKRAMPEMSVRIDPVQTPEDEA